MKNFHIERKLILSFLIVSAITSIPGIVTLLTAQRTDFLYNNVLVVDDSAQDNSGRFNNYLYKESAFTRDILLLNEEDEMRAVQQELRELTVKLTDTLEELKRYSGSSDDVAHIAAVDRALPQYLKIRDQIVALCIQGKSQEALEIFRGEGRPLLDSCIQEAEALADLYTTRQPEVTTDLSGQSRKNTELSIVTILASFLIAMVFGVFVSRSISRSMKEMAREK